MPTEHVELYLAPWIVTFGGAAVAGLQSGGTVVADDKRIHLLGEVDENEIAGDSEGRLQPITEIYSGGFQTAVAEGVRQGDPLLVRGDGST